MHSEYSVFTLEPLISTRKDLTIKGRSCCGWGEQDRKNVGPAPQHNLQRLLNKIVLPKVFFISVSNYDLEYWVTVRPRLLLPAGLPLLPNLPTVGSTGHRRTIQLIGCTSQEDLHLAAALDELDVAGRHLRLAGRLQEKQWESLLHSTVCSRPGKCCRI